MDGFIEDLLQEIYTIPLYSKNWSTCDSKVYEEMDHIVLNKLEVAGLIISDEQHHEICSTLGGSKIPLSNSTHSRTVEGPFRVSVFDQPVYLVQQKIGSHYIAILFIYSTLKSVLTPDNGVLSSVELYDQLNKRGIIKVAMDNNTETTAPMNN